MSDQRSTYYCNTQDVTEVGFAATRQTAIALNGTSGSSQTNKDRVYVTAANTLPFTPGDSILIYDSANPAGETATVQSIVSSGATPYLELTGNLTGDYTVAQSAKVVLLSAFVSQKTTNATGTITALTRHSSEEVNRFINQAEGYIETLTGHAWRSITVQGETHDFPQRIYTSRDWIDGLPIKLNNRAIKSATASDGSYIPDTAAGDKLEVYYGGGWVDWLGTRVAGRTGNYWLDTLRGILYLRGFYRIYSRMAVRVTYRYGESTVPNDIRRAAALIAASALLENEDFAAAVPGGGDLNIIPVEVKRRAWREEAEDILRRRVEMKTVW